MRNARFSRLLIALPPLLFLIPAACSLDSPYVRVRVEMPAAPEVQAGDYREFVVAGFFLPETAAEVDLAGDMSAFFEEALKSRASAAVSRRDLTLDQESLLKDEEFWKREGGKADKALFLTGKARFDQELRKALLEKNRSRVEEPFTSDKTWDERKSFTLQATLMLIDGATGRPVFEKDYKEVGTYSNIKQPARFALFDIMQRLKVKFFRALFGTERIQERYLLYR